MGKTEAYTRAALTGGVVEQQVRAVEPDAEIEVAVAEQMDRQRLLWPPDARWFFLREGLWSCSTINGNLQGRADGSVAVGRGQMACHRADAPSIKTRTRLFSSAWISGRSAPSECKRQASVVHGQRTVAACPDGVPH